MLRIERKSSFVKAEDEAFDTNAATLTRAIVATSAQRSQVGRINRATPVLLERHDVIDASSSDRTDKSLAHDAPITVACDDPLANPPPYSLVVEPGHKV
jgi:hypothetical protein